MKIGLIAMSGIRAYDEELLRLGLTLPGFVERSKTIASLPSLGLLTLAGMIPKSFDVEYIEVPDIKIIGAIPKDLDLVAISTYSAQVDEAYELADTYRKLGISTVIGGPHVSCVPEEAAAHCDAVVIGEGELSWTEVINDAQKGRLKRYYGSRGGSFDLNDAPMPAFELLDISKYNRLTVQTSRGCPHQCEFCASSIILSSRYKQKPVDKVLNEIDKIFSIWDHPFIEFADDNSIVNKQYWKELLTRLGRKKIRWFTETDISVSEDNKLLDLMRDSGCAQVLIGLESPNEVSLDGIEMKTNWKMKKFRCYKKAIRNIQSHGITVNGCFVIGLDGNGSDIFDEVFDFVKELGLYEVQITVPTPFPGTPFYDRLKKEKRLINEKDWKRCTLFDLNFIPRNMSVEELKKGFRDLGVKLYSEEFTKWRRDNFKDVLRSKVVKKKEAYHDSKMD